VGGDLMHDVWPGTTSGAALRRAFMYYVYLFEQWRNWVVPGVLLAVMILSIALVVQGTVAWLFLGFPVWSVGCIGFATLWPALLQRRGRVRQRLPVPLCKNSYSAADPLWAHFVTVMHIVMVLCLIADVVTLNVRIYARRGYASVGHDCPPAPPPRRSPGPSRRGAVALAEPLRGLDSPRGGR